MPPQKDLSQDTLKAIEDKKIKPLPRWYFLLKNFTLWTLFLLAGFFASFALSVIAILFLHDDFSLHSHMQKGLWRHLLISFPFFWFAILAIFLVFLHYIYKKTKEGYRYERKIAMGTGLAVFFILAFAGFYSGLSDFFNQHFLANHLYDRMVYEDRETWEDPDNGFLSGKITDLDHGEYFMVKDSRGKLWQIMGNFKKEPQDFSIEKGINVRIIGRVRPSNIFDAEIIRR